LQVNRKKTKPVQQQKKRPIAVTLGTDDDGCILARADNEAVKVGAVQLLDFVRIGRTMGRIVKIIDDHDFPRDNEIARIAKECLRPDRKPDPSVEEMVYKKLVIEPMGSALENGELVEYTGGIGFFQKVFRATDQDIATLYPLSDAQGLNVGKIASGYKVSNVDFRLGVSALTRHMAVFGKNGTGKTNFLKELITSNLELPEPLPMLVFGHPDIGSDNPNDKGTVGLGRLENSRVVMLGYKEALKLSPDEIALDDRVHSRKEGTELRCQGDRIECLNRRGAQQLSDESLPASGEQLTSDEQHPLSVIRRPEDAWAFHSQVDNPSDGAFDSPTADGQAHLLEFGIAHPVGVLPEESDLFVHLGSTPAPTEVLQGIQHHVQTPFFEAFTLGVEPVGALLVCQFSTGIDGAGEMFCGVCPIEDFDHTRLVQAQCLDQSSHPVPVLRGAICDKDQKVCL
jgi:hypothetical protein